MQKTFRYGARIFKHLILREKGKETWPVTQEVGCGVPPPYFITGQNGKVSLQRRRAEELTSLRRRNQYPGLMFPEGLCMSFACWSEGAWKCQPREADLDALVIKGMDMLDTYLESGDEAL